MHVDDAIQRIRGFNRFYTNLIGVLDGHILRSPYSLTEVRVLYEIAHDDGSHARKLKTVLAVDEGYLSRTIDHLVSEGLVRKSRSRTDGRVFHLSLTAAGRRELDRLTAAASAEINGIVRSLSAAQVEEVVTSMERIQTLLGTGGKA